MFNCLLNGGQGATLIRRDEIPYALKEMGKCQMYNYWGKYDSEKQTIHLLPYHCLDVAAVMHCLLHQHPLSQQWSTFFSDQAELGENQSSLFVYLAALHDVGKFSESFQAKAPTAVELLGTTASSVNGYHHTEEGYWYYEQYLVEVLAELFDDDPDDLFDVLEPLANAVFCHHGKPSTESIDYSCGFSKSNNAIREFAEDTFSFLAKDAVIPKEDEIAAASWLFAGLLIIADWIGSNVKWFPHCADKISLSEYWETRALPRAQSAIAGTGIISPKASSENSFTGLMPHLGERAVPTPLQKYALDDAVRTCQPQLHIFEDLTGGGKTEAAMLCAHKLMQQTTAAGFYIGLPTMATANGMYSRVAATYQALFDEDISPSLVLAHGARHIHEEFLSIISKQNTGDEDCNGSCVAWLADSRKKALLAPCGVGTIDQALIGVLPAKHQALRLAGLSQHVLIVDEVHAYDAYTSELLKKLLEFHAALGGSAILLSATLPHKLKQLFAKAFMKGAGYRADLVDTNAFPLATAIDECGVRTTPFDTTRTLYVEVSLTDSEECIYEEVLEAAKAGGCVCWIRNTVGQATNTYDRLLTQFGVSADDVLLFHSRFAMEDRLRIENTVLTLFGKTSTPADRRGKILIATQVIEQSLDVDFDFLVSDLAPMDLLIQRRGRCHRHKRERPALLKRPRMRILSPKPTREPSITWYKSVLGPAAYVYPFQSVLWKTAALLAEKTHISLPEDARLLVETVYDESSFAPRLLLEADEREAQAGEFAKCSLAKSNLLEFDAGYSASSSHRGWTSEENFPTRIGSPTERIRLLRYENGKLSLWSSEQTIAKACFLSEVSVRLDAITPIVPAELVRQYAELCETMPDKGKWRKLLILECQDGLWRGIAEEVVQYNRKRGLVRLDV